MLNQLQSLSSSGVPAHGDLATFGGPIILYGLLALLAGAVVGGLVVFAWALPFRGRTRLVPTLHFTPGRPRVG